MTHIKPQVHPKHRHTHKNRVAHLVAPSHNGNAHKFKALVTPAPALIPAPAPELIPAASPVPVPPELEQPEGHGGTINARLAAQQKVREATPVPQVCADARAAVEANTANNLMLHEIATTLMEQLNILKDSADFKVGQSIQVLNNLVTRIDKFTNINA
jgi:hypothetical protein